MSSRSLQVLRGRILCPYVRCPNGLESGVNPETVAILAIVIAAGSEIIAVSPLRSNSWLQLLLQALKLMFPKR